MKISRSAQRETAFILLFEYIVKGDETAEEIWENAVEIPNLKELPYVKQLFFGCTEHKTEIDMIVDKSLVGWKSERVSFVSRAILTLAAFEMIRIEDIPYKVSIDEAIKLSKKYEAGKAYKFINGVLNAVADDLGLKVAEDE